MRRTYYLHSERTNLCLNHTFIYILKVCINTRYNTFHLLLWFGGDMLHGGYLAVFIPDKLITLISVYVRKTVWEEMHITVKVVLMACIHQTQFQ